MNIISGLLENLLKGTPQARAEDLARLPQPARFRYCRRISFPSWLFVAHVAGRAPRPHRSGSEVAASRLPPPRAIVRALARYKSLNAKNRRFRCAFSMASGQDLDGIWCDERVR